ncbi:DUF4038 domain-containing protein [Chloroflexota bacterium]
MPQIEQWTVFETTLTSTEICTDPFWELDVTVTFTGPSGVQQTVNAFWDGGATWRTRFMPSAVGAWQWTTTCTDPANSGLHAQSGAFDCRSYTGDNPLYQHGPLQLSADHRYLIHRDGTPFFWLADTAWNGALKAQPKDWHTFLNARQAQNFTVIQFVGMQWRACPVDRRGESSFTGAEHVQINPQVFQRVDEQLTAINARGMVAAPVLVWALTDDDPGNALSEADIIRLAQYQVARWGAYHVVWILGGDCDYLRDERVAKWERIGTAVFAQRHSQPVTMHPCGQNWGGAAFRGVDWFDFISYQSGHGDSDEHLRWLVEGPPALHWADDPPLPIINLEPNYEGHPAYHSQTLFAADHMRRAAYWSLLIGPPAGVTYGHQAIWPWHEKPGIVLGHGDLATTAWTDSVEAPGAVQMGLLSSFFSQFEWWALRPAPDLLADQPGATDPAKFIAAAQTMDGQWAVIYTPVGDTLPLTAWALASVEFAQWFNPRTGAWRAATINNSGLTPPDELDWLLVLGKE